MTSTLDGHTTLKPIIANEQLSDFVVVPNDAPRTFRRKLGLRPGETPRVAFIAGPGDVAGTFDHWIEGRFDPRTPVVAYSSMFYTLIEKLDANALLISEPANLPSGHDPRFRFASIPRERPNGGLAYRRAGVDFSRKVVEELKRYRPHLVLLGVDTPLFLMRSLPRTTKVVLTAHNNFWAMGLRSNAFRHRLKRWVSSLSMRRIDAGVCTSEETRRQVGELRGSLDGLFTETPQVLSQFASQPRRLSQLKHILFLGRIEEEKGVFDLLAAYEAVAAKSPDLILSIAGRGEVEAELKRRVDISPFRDRINLLGQLNSQDVHRQLEHTDLLVCPTRSNFLEGLALVVVEAAVHEVPSLLSSVVPAKELVAGACVEFAADDIDALVAALDSLAFDPGKLTELQELLIGQRQKFFDRSKSWGSLLYRAFIA